MLKLASPRPIPGRNLGPRPHQRESRVVSGPSSLEQWPGRLCPQCLLPTATENKVTQDARTAWESAGSHSLDCLLEPARREEQGCGSSVGLASLLPSPSWYLCHEWQLLESRMPAARKCVYARVCELPFPCLSAERKWLFLRLFLVSRRA